MDNKGIVVLLSTILISSLALADDKAMNTGADITAPIFTKAKYKYVKKPITADDGNFHGYLRMHHIFDGKGNGFDPETGSTLGFGLGYGAEVLTPGLKIGAEVYGVMDSGLTNTDETAVAYGQFLNKTKKPSELDPGMAWGAHISYEKMGVYKATIGRSQFTSPLTNIQITHVPNLYEFARLDGKVMKGKASLAYITKMSYGSRAAADFGLIGEKTGTAGMAISPFTNPKTYLTRGEYQDIDETVGSNSSNGILVAGYEKRIRKFDFKVWDFMIDDIANNLYAEGTYKFPLGGKGKVFKLSGQAWNQTISNDAFKAKYGGLLVGAQALLKWKTVVAKLAYTTKDEGGLLNAWGANPGYTSSIFSRNEYRGDVDAYKATLVYMPMKGLKMMVSYADYGQSSMKLGTLASQTDATERDIAIIYKPRPDIMIKLFNADRVSEYSTAGKKSQNHTRLIMNYAF